MYVGQIQRRDNCQLLFGLEMSSTLVVIKELASEREWNNTASLCSKWINNGITTIDANRASSLRKELKKDAELFIDERLRYVPIDWPGRKYVDSMTRDLV